MTRDYVGHAQRSRLFRAGAVADPEAAVGSSCLVSSDGR